MSELMEDIDYFKQKAAAYNKAHEDDPNFGDILNFISRYKPTIVCLCGSTKFADAFQEANKQLTLEGKIVLSVGFFAHAKKEYVSEEGKRMLDALHKRKIDIADEVFVLNVGGYIGDSTRSEIEYANSHGVNVAYLEEVSNEP